MTLLNKIKENTKYRYIFVLILMLPFFKPACLEEIHLEFILNIYRVLKLIAILFVIYTVIKERKIDKIYILVAIYLIIFLGATILNHGVIKEALSISISIFFPIYLANYFIRKDAKSFFKGLNLLLEIFIYINFLTIILFPNGLYQGTINKVNYFLGYDNGHINYFLLGMAVSGIHAYLTHGKIISFRSIIMYIICLLSVLIRWTATGVGGLILFPIVLGICYLLKGKWVNVYSLLATAFLVTIGIVIFQIQNLFSFIIVDILKKDITFTGRTTIWARSIENIVNSHFLGKGYADLSQRALENGGKGLVNAHNQILEICYLGGIPLLISFGAIIVVTTKPLYEKRKTSVAWLLTALLFIYGIMMIFEAYNLCHFFLILVFGYNISQVIQEVKS